MAGCRNPCSGGSDVFNLRKMTPESAIFFLSSRLVGPGSRHRRLVPAGEQDGPNVPTIVEE